MKGPCGAPAGTDPERYCGLEAGHEGCHADGPLAWNREDIAVQVNGDE